VTSTSSSPSGSTAPLPVESQAAEPLTATAPAGMAWNGATGAVEDAASADVDPEIHPFTWVSPMGKASWAR
jgi:hypothetical protein